MFDKIRHFFLHYGLSICVALTILYLCMMPSSNTEHFHITNGDKFVHAFMYLCFTFCICLNFYKQDTEFKSLTMFMWAIVIPILYGGLIEVMQGELTVSRSCDINDLIADAIGTLIGFGVSWYFIPRYFKRNEF